MRNQTTPFPLHDLPCRLLARGRGTARCDSTSALAHRLGGGGGALDLLGLLLLLLLLLAVLVLGGTDGGLTQGLTALGVLGLLGLLENILLGALLAQTAVEEGPAKLTGIALHVE